MTGILPVLREHIVSTPETCGGQPRIAGSRVRVKDIAILHVHQGDSPPEIVSKWPHLTLAAVHAALAYYHDHREEMTAEILADLTRYDERSAAGPSLLRQKLDPREVLDVSDHSIPS